MSYNTNQLILFKKLGISILLLIKISETVYEMVVTQYENNISGVPAWKNRNEYGTVM